MARRVDPLKAKQARQKKIAIGGVVVLVALLAVQGPKTLKMLKGPQAIPTPATATPAATPPLAVPGTTTGTPVATPAAGDGLASVADSDAAPTVEKGQLATFERFASKDPFAQQAQPVAPPAPTVAPDADAEGADTPDKGQAGSGETPAAGDAADGESGGFTTGGPTGTPAPAELASATSISINGVAEDVAVEGAFPKELPTFVLVSVAKNGKSVEIGIAGGEYAGGGETMRLVLGKKLTLQNTADGSRYELELRAVQGFPVPKTAKSG